MSPRHLRTVAAAALLSALRRAVPDGLTGRDARAALAGVRQLSIAAQVLKLTRDFSITYSSLVEDEDLVFKALADPTRRLLLDRLFERDGMTLGELEAEVPQLTRFGVMRHLGVLEQAGLVVTRKQGRHKHHYLNPVPIRLIYERWIDKYRARQAAALLDLKGQLEGRQ